MPIRDESRAWAEAARDKYTDYQRVLADYEADGNPFKADIAIRLRERSLAEMIPHLLGEIERLRDLAWKLHRAMTGEHDKATHFLDIDDCAPCLKARDEGDPEFACGEYKTWQKAYADALCLVIGPRPEQDATTTRPKLTVAEHGCDLNYEDDEVEQWRDPRGQRSADASAKPECTCPPLAPNMGVIDVNRGHVLGCPVLAWQARGGEV